MCGSENAVNHCPVAEIHLKLCVVSLKKSLGTRKVLNETSIGENVMVCNDQRLFEKRECS